MAEESFEATSLQNQLIALREKLKMFIYALCCLREVDPAVIVSELDSHISALLSFLELPQFVSEADKCLLSEINQLSNACFHMTHERHRIDNSAVLRNESPILE